MRQLLLPLLLLFVPAGCIVERCEYTPETDVTEELEAELARDLSEPDAATADAARVSQ